VGQWVWLCLINQSLASLEVEALGKLGPKYFRPFLLGEVVYRLQLLTDARSTLSSMSTC
jgi:hypothetical protein